MEDGRGEKFMVRAPALPADDEYWKVVDWLVEPGDLVSRGQLIVELESDHTRTQFKLDAKQRSAISAFVVAEGGRVSGRGALAECEAAPQQEENPGLVPYLMVAAAVVAVVAVVAGIIFFTRGDSDTSDRAPGNPLYDGAIAAERTARCMPGSEVPYRTAVRTNVPGAFAWNHRTSYAREERSAAPSVIELVACPFEADGRPSRRPFHRGERVSVAWARPPDSVKRTGSLCLTTTIRGGRYIRRMEFTSSWRSVYASPTGAGSGQRIYRLSGGWPDRGFVAGQFEVMLTGRTDLPLPRITVAAALCRGDSSPSAHPRTYGATLTAVRNAPAPPQR